MAPRGNGICTVFAFLPGLPKALATLIISLNMKAEMWLFDVPLLPDKHSDELKRLVGTFVCNDDIISA